MSLLTDPLVLQFAKDRPDELAGVLGTARLDELSALFAELPSESAAVLAALLPSWQLRSLLNKLSPERTKQLLLSANTSDAVSIVSQLPEFRYPDILNACNDQERSQLRTLFEFPSHSLASLALPRFISAEAKMTCEAFAKKLMQNEDTRPQPIFVVDAQSQYLGRLFYQAVFSIKNRKKNLEDVMTRVEALSGMTSAEMALGSRLWTQHHELAVIDSKRRLLGVIDKALLQRVAGNTGSVEFSAERLFSELATDYLNACSQLLESFLGRKS